MFNLKGRAKFLSILKYSIMNECEKIKLTEEESKEELQRIVEGVYKPWNNPYVPRRRYCCQICSTKDEKVYHLTSKPTIIEY